MTSIGFQLEEFSKLGKVELRRLYLQSFNRISSSPITPASVYMMLEYGFITSDEFKFIIAP